MKGISYIEALAHLLCKFEWQDPLAISLYEGYLTYKVTDAVTQQPIVAGHDTTHHIKAIGVPFYLTYGSLKCVKRL